MFFLAPSTSQDAVAEPVASRVKDTLPLVANWIERTSVMEMAKEALSEPSYNVSASLVSNARTTPLFERVSWASTERPANEILLPGELELAGREIDRAVEGRGRVRQVTRDGSVREGVHRIGVHVQRPGGTGVDHRGLGGRQDDGGEATRGEGQVNLAVKPTEMLSR